MINSKYKTLIAKGLAALGSVQVGVVQANAIESIDIRDTGPLSGNLMVISAEESVLQ